MAISLPLNRVSRVLLNLTIDSVAAALLMAMVGTGYILAFALPPGTNRTHVLWGLLRHQWGAVHFWISVALLAVLAVHVALHWRWLVAGLTRRFGLEAWAARSPRLATLSVLATAGLPLTTLALAAHVSVRPMETPLHPLADGGGAPDATPERRDAAPDPTSSRAAAVLRERCAACHGARDPAAGVRADTPAALEQVQTGVRWIVPGDPGRSRLFEVVGVPSTTRAIAPRHRLSEAESDALRAWVASLDRAARRDSSWSRIACAPGRGMVAPARAQPPQAESRRRAQLRARSAVDRGTDVAPWRRAAHRRIG